MKKTIALLLSTMLLLTLSACGGTQAGNTAATESNVTPKAELVIKATNYEFDQPVYHLKKDVPVKIVFKNEAGNHGVLIPKLNLQLDSEHESAVVTPTETGEFDMACSISCGTGHSRMIAKIVVE
ncbi:cytochrome C oxidase subunit II [Paenibacillus sp. YPG26]|uniref:cytochrome C oxidase subunit II n=1 Tax=Paenibacillus sp. YPG26 TaxID=2878915 RepID=UPI00203E35D3|nr:cytochrome C oxidase subunit II [Paenibacillus sp. YPG26]USB34190.1 cytochrome C oxidase subunit II [Paenibacillus sp. YPG26]